MNASPSPGPAAARRSVAWLALIPSLALNAVLLICAGHMAAKQTALLADRSAARGAVRALSLAAWSEEWRQGRVLWLTPDPRPGTATGTWSVVAQVMRPADTRMARALSDHILPTNHRLVLDAARDRAVAGDRGLVTALQPYLTSSPFVSPAEAADCVAYPALTAARRTAVEAGARDFRARLARAASSEF